MTKGWSKHRLEVDAEKHGELKAWILNQTLVKSYLKPCSKKIKFWCFGGFGTIGKTTIL